MQQDQTTIVPLSEPSANYKDTADHIDLRTPDLVGAPNTSQVLKKVQKTNQWLLERSQPPICKRCSLQHLQTNRDISKNDIPKLQMKPHKLVVTRTLRKGFTGERVPVVTIYGEYRCPAMVSEISKGLLGQTVSKNKPCGLQLSNQLVSEEPIKIEDWFKTDLGKRWEPFYTKNSVGEHEVFGAK